MAYQVVYKKTFFNDTSNLIAYLDAEWGSMIKDEFIDELERTIKMLSIHPFIGSPSIRYKGARGIYITPHNRLFYRVSDNKIAILALAATRRKNYR